MKNKLSKNTKKAICIYVVLLIILYVVVEVLPRVTDIFEITQTLKPGNLKLSYDTTGYFIKDEKIGIAAESGDIDYLVAAGSSIKKGTPLVSVTPKGSNKEEAPRFSEYTERLKGYDGLSEAYTSPMSGVFSLQIDGYEDYFTPARMEKIKREKVESFSFHPVSLERKSVIKGEPVYKVSWDDAWYILCWVDRDTAETYSEGRSVTLELPEGSVKAKIQSISKEKDSDEFRVIFYLNVFYEAFSSSRAEEMSIVTSDNEGLIIDNKCIIEKDGQKGVYVINKNGRNVFTRIKVIAYNKEQSVIDDVTFIDEEGNQVYTVDVYDEVLKHPASALEKELEKEAQEKAEKQTKKENE